MSIDALNFDHAGRGGSQAGLVAAIIDVFSSHGNRAMESKMEMWGGIECTINRVGEQYHEQLGRSGHTLRVDDLDRFFALGIRTIRYPVLWESVAPNGVANADWTWADERLSIIRRLGMSPIVGLVHHGSGPPHTDLLDEKFATGLGEYAGLVAARFPWIDYWTPVNEPLTTARFSALYGIWFPHARDDCSFVLALLNQCKATVLAMQAIRRANPRAKLVQTDDLGRTFGTRQMSRTIDFYNERRWLGWDLLCGRVDKDHPLWGYLVKSGADICSLEWFKANRCPPDFIGVIYYVTSDRWLDHRTALYPECCLHDASHFIDIEAVRHRAAPGPRLLARITEAWDRYRIPIVVTEAHMGSGREDQLRWLWEVWEQAIRARQTGVQILAVTAWSLLGSFDWNCLLAESHGYYEPGPFDIRAPRPRPTALSALINELANGVAPRHPVLADAGWWRCADRFISAPGLPKPVSTLKERGPSVIPRAAPILIAGATGMLGRAFAHACRARHLSFRLLDRQEMDIADSESCARAISRWKPWAIVNATGYADIDSAEKNSARCFRENTVGPALLAAHCSFAGVRLVTFSSDQVFDGRGTEAKVETSVVQPLNVYGKSKAAAESEVLAKCPEAMVVRTSGLFGPWNARNFLTKAISSLARGNEFFATDDGRMSPTYVPDMVNACLDLLIDGESGIWHLANKGNVSWADFARTAASYLRVDASKLRICSAQQLGQIAKRPRFATLCSEKGFLMPSLEDALGRFRNEHEKVVHQAKWNALDCMAMPSLLQSAYESAAVARC